MTASAHQACGATSSGWRSWRWRYVPASVARAGHLPSLRAITTSCLDCSVRALPFVRGALHHPVGAAVHDPAKYFSRRTGVQGLHAPPHRCLSRGVRNVPSASQRAGCQCRTYARDGNAGGPQVLSVRVVQDECILLALDDKKSTGAAGDAPRRSPSVQPLKVEEGGPRVDQRTRPCRPWWSMNDQIPAGPDDQSVRAASARRRLRCA